MVISEKNKVLINRVIDTIDWTLIHKFYKLVGRTIGTETTQISKLTDEHIKGEVLHVVNHVVENDISQYAYGPWNIVWVNGEWEMEIPEIDENGKEIENGESSFIPIMESMLEIYFSPMIVVSKETVLSEEEVDEKPETADLQKQLEKALSDENYELASKLRDLIEVYKKQK
jgi:hypothetical protein